MRQGENSARWAVQRCLAEPEETVCGLRVLYAPLSAEVSCSGWVWLGQGKDCQRQAWKEQVVRQHGNAEPGGHHPGDHGVLLRFVGDGGPGVDLAEQLVYRRAQAAVGREADLRVGEGLPQGNTLPPGQRMF